MNLTTKAIKAKDHELVLKGPTLMVGPNGAGKSTLAEALRFLALGYVPALGKRPQDTAALMSGREMSVTLAMDDGRSVRRWISREAKGFIQGADASWIRNGKATEISEEIKRLFGAEDQDAAECLDIREILAATPNQRAARLEALASAGRKTAAQLAEAVARFTIQRLADISDERMPEDYMAAMAMVPEKQAEVLKVEAKMLYSKISDGGLAGALTWANEQKRTAAEGLHRKEQAAQELRIRAVEVPEPAAQELKNLESLRQKLDRDFGAAAQAKAGYDAMMRRREAAFDAAKETESNLERWEAYQRNELAGKVKQLSDSKAALVRLEADAPAPPVLETDGRIEALRDSAEEYRRMAMAIKPAPELSTAAERDALARIESDYERAKASPWTEVVQIAKEISKTLPKVAKRLKELAGANQIDPETLKEELDAARVALDQAELAQTKAAAASQKQADERATLLERAKDAETEASDREHELRTRNASASEAWQAAVSNRVGQLAQLRREVEALQKDVAASQQAIERARDRHAAALAAIEAAGTDPVTAPPVASSEIEKKLAKVRDSLRQLQEAQAVHQEIQRALAAIEDAQAAAKVFAAIEWALFRQRQHEISEAGGPLLAVMGDFLQAAGRGEKAYVRAGAGQCAIGWTKIDGSEISVEALSGGEWCLFTAALTAAILILRNPPIKILLVEAGEADPETLKQLCAAISHMAPKLTGAIVMTQTGPRKAPPGWQLIAYSNAETAEVVEAR